MSSTKRLSRALANAKQISFDNSSKFVFFSDCHRGDNSFADDFANNRNIYFHALTYYFKNNFNYCELGDGDELWENLNFKAIFEAHKNVYQLLKKFHLEDRLHMVWGNHDMVYRDAKVVAKQLGIILNLLMAKTNHFLKDSNTMKHCYLPIQKAESKYFALTGIRLIGGTITFGK